MRLVKILAVLLPLAIICLSHAEEHGGGGAHGAPTKETAHEGAEAGGSGAGGHGHESAEQTDMVERPARNSSRDVKIPKSLVAKLENEYRTFLTKNGVSTKSNISRKLLNLTAELTQKHAAALHENTRVVTPLGGGVVDLAEFVTPLKGAFHLKMLARKEDGHEPTGLRVFYVSKAKIRKIDGDDFGAGCDKYMEITSYYHNKLAKGFELYTAGQRYVSVLSGTFVAVVFEKEALQVASMTFQDSRYPELACD